MISWNARDDDGGARRSDRPDRSGHRRVSVGPPPCQRTSQATWVSSGSGWIMVMVDFVLFFLIAEIASIGGRPHGSRGVHYNNGIPTYCARRAKLKSRVDGIVSTKSAE